MTVPMSTIGRQGSLTRSRVNVTAPRLSSPHRLCQQYLTKIKNDLSVQAASNGLHQFLLKEFNLSMVGVKLNRLGVDFVEVINKRLSNAVAEESCRQAYVLRNYVNYFTKVRSGKITLLSRKGYPDYVEAVGKLGQHKMILFRDGKVQRVRWGLETVNFGKKWSLSFEALNTEELLQLFYNELISDYEENPNNCNSIYIRSSRNCALRIVKFLEGETIVAAERARTWFSLVRRYSHGFFNRRHSFGYIYQRNPGIVFRLLKHKWIKPCDKKEKYVCVIPDEIKPLSDPTFQDPFLAWLREPSNSVLMRLDLTKGNYLAILERFKEKILKSEIEGLHPVNDTAFIAKFEKKAPTFALNGYDLLENADIIIEQYGLD